MDFQLNLGFEGSAIVPSKNPGEFFILGGNNYKGASLHVFKYNLKNKTVINQKPLVHKIVISKYIFYDNGDVLILNDGQAKGAINYEIYNVYTAKSRTGFLKKPYYLTEIKNYNHN